MKKLIAVFLIALVFASSSFAAVRVKGHMKKNGTYVNSYYRTSPNSTVTDNYSYKGNYNPHTGKYGTNYYRNDPTSEYYRPSYNTPSDYYYQDTPKIIIDPKLAPPKIERLRAPPVGLKD